MIFAGIDVSKNKHDCYIVDSDGAVISESLRIENTIEGYEKLCTILLSSCNKNIKNVKIGLEATGHYSTNITNYLHSKGFCIKILNPLATNLFRKSHTLRKTKTDKTDAKVIATMLFTDESKSYSPVSYQIQELKSLTRNRFRLIGYRAKLKVSITRLLDVIFPELQKFFWSIHQTSSYALLLELPSTKEIQKCHLTKLTNLLRKSSKYHYGKDKAIALKALSAKSVGCCNRALSFELQQTIRLVQSLNAEIKAVDEEIKIIIDEIQTPLMTVPGISYTLAAIILSEIGDIHCFSTPAKLLAFAGMEPSTYQSGKYTASKTPMVKRGSPYLRWAMIQAARLISLNDLTFKEYLNKKISEGKHFNVALTHVGKKLLRVIFYLLKSNKSFVPQP